MSKGKGKADRDRYYIGIDAGSVSLNCIVINQNRKPTSGTWAKLKRKP